MLCDVSSQGMKPKDCDVIDYCILIVMEATDGFSTAIARPYNLFIKEMCNRFPQRKHQLVTNTHHRLGYEITKYAAETGSPKEKNIGC
jgi:hypothetical protein